MSGRPGLRTQGLSPRQQVCLDAIRAWLDRTARTPSYRELRAELGVRSTQAVADQLAVLESKGFITCALNQAYGIRLTEKALRAAPARGGLS